MSLWDATRLLHLGGITSPGLTSAASISHALLPMAGMSSLLAIATASTTSLEALSIVSDIAAWSAYTVLGFMLGHAAWQLRHRIPFVFTGGTLILIDVAIAIKRVLDFRQVRASLLQGSSSSSVHALVEAAVLSILVSLAFIILSPFIRKVIEFGLTADEEHQRFLTAAETSLHAFCILNTVRTPFRGVTDFTFAFANSVAHEYLGEESTQLTSRNLSEVLPNLHESGIFRHLKHVAQTGVAYHGRVKDRSRSGKDLWFNLKAVRTDDGLAVVLHDLTEERQRQRVLEEMNRFSQSIIEDAPFSIVAVDAAGIITAVNSATQVLTQYRRDELVGKHSIIMLHDPAELSSRSVELTQECGHPVSAGFETLSATLGKRRSNESEWSYIRKDGKRIAVHLAMTALRGSDREVTGYLAIAFDISERKALTDSISFLAHHDALTRLPNRVLLNERLHATIQQASYLSRRVAVFVIDVDHFKRINDSLGHVAGDELLISIAERLKSAVRTTDLVARTGGDDFIIMMPNAGEVDDIMRSGARLLNAFSSPVHAAGRELNVNASIGVCIFPDLANDAVSLIRNADAAMYAAKRKGRNSLHAFSEQMLEANADRLELEADLRRALERNELILHYQPQVNTRTHEIMGVEALLRWRHPSRGMVPPSEFIQVAEEGGMIVPMGEWVVRHACQEVRRMQQEIGRRFTLAVNLSPRQVLQDNLVEVIEDALRTSGLAPEDLELEITENTLMISSAETLAMLARLRSLGVRLAVDDFGTGFSSFKYILEYKVDRLKIDRSFTAKCPDDPTATAIVRTVIAMAHGLNMTVVAEGVETEEQLAFLLRRRCDQAQGFRFGRPVPLKELRDRLIDTIDSQGPSPRSAEAGSGQSETAILDLPDRAIAIT